MPKTLYTSDNILEINEIKSVLDSYDIYTFITDEHMNTILPFYQLAIGGIKLNVDEKEYDHALSIIEEYKLENASMNQELPPEEFIPAYFENIECPKCQSNDISKMKRDNKPLITLLLFFLFMIPIPVKKNYYQCNNCHAYWNTGKFSYKKLFLLLAVITGFLLSMYYR